MLFGLKHQVTIKVHSPRLLEKLILKRHNSVLTVQSSCLCKHLWKNIYFL